MATWTAGHRQLCISDDNDGRAEKSRDWMTVAEELSKESNPARVRELSKELVDALDRRASRRIR